jgi:phosphate transport system permease protein
LSPWPTNQVLDRLPDRLLLWTLRAGAAVSAAIVLVIAAFVILESLPALRAVGLARFFTDASWHPAGGADAGRFNLVPILAGSVLATTGALVLATPIGLASALFCQFYAPPAAALLHRRIVELLAGIPSVVYGFWGLVVLTPAIRAWQPPGQSLLAAILILAIMVLPTIALLADAGLRAVPAPYLHGAAALGLSRWATIRGVALPAARGALVGAIVLATGRAFGETMAVLMVSGNVVQVPASVVDPVRVLTANIALELGYAQGQHRSALFVSGLVLMAVACALVLVAQRLRTGPRDA